MDENMNYTPTPGGTPNPAPYTTPNAAPVYTAPTTGPVYSTPGTGPAYAAPGAGPAYSAPGAGPAYTAPGTGPMYAAPVPAPKKSPLVPLLILAAVVVVAICAAVFFITRNSATSVAKRYVTGYYENDKLASSLWVYDYEALLLTDYDGDEEAFFEDMSDEYDADITSWNEYYKAVDTYWKEYWEDSYGKYKVSVDVVRSKDISVRKLMEDESGAISYLEENLNFDSDKISAAKIVTVKGKLAGEDDIKRDKFEIYMVKIGFTWHVLDWDFIED